MSRLDRTHAHFVAPRAEGQRAADYWDEVTWLMRQHPGDTFFIGTFETLGAADGPRRTLGRRGVNVVSVNKAEPGYNVWARWRP